MKTTKIIAILVLSLCLGKTTSADLPLGWDESYVDLSNYPAVPVSTLYNQVTDTWMIGCYGPPAGMIYNYEHHVYTYLKGDGQIVARVVDATYPGIAGMVIKEQYTEWRKAIITASGTFIASDGSTNEHIYPSNNELPYWLRLERKGDKFTGSISPDGVNWTVIASVPLSISIDTYIGLRVLGEDPNVPYMARFDNVTLSGDTGDGRGVFGGAWEVTDSNMYSLLPGNVGIGTSSPTEKLEVRGGPIKATGGLIIETRDSDPSNPVTGQIWLIIDP